MSTLRPLLIASVLGALLAGFACVDPPHEDLSFSCSQTDPSCPGDQVCNPQDWCCHERDPAKDFPLNACGLVQGSSSGSDSSNSISDSAASTASVDSTASSS